ILFLERKWGVHFAMGGTGALVDGLVRLIEGQGNSIRLNETVSEIVMDERGKKPRAAGVKLENGEVIDADLVVSNADAAWTYRHLVPSRYRKRWTDKKIDRARYSMSLFVWYFGTDRKYDDVAHHTILLGPRYKGLLDDIFERKVLADDFSLYLHRPTTTDPSMAPEGCDAFYVLSPVPHLDSGVDWEEQCEPYRKKVEKYLAATVLPDLGKHLVTSHTLDPQGFRDIMLSHKGAAFSVEPTLTQSAYFRPHNRSEDIEHLYLVGAGTHPGAGMPGVISSARVLDTVVPDADAISRVKKAG
ncbi:MAG: phytoene desaturase family protein, partial [Myxococcota bacterium]